MENDEDKKNDEKFGEEVYNYSDSDELFGENCKFRFLVINQYVISKKPKACVNYTFYYFT